MPGFKLKLCEKHIKIFYISVPFHKKPFAAKMSSMISMILVSKVS